MDALHAHVRDCIHCQQGGGVDGLCPAGAELVEVAAQASGTGFGLFPELREISAPQPETESVAASAALANPCRECGAKAGERCKWLGGYFNLMVHGARVQDVAQVEESAS